MRVLLVLFVVELLPEVALAFIIISSSSGTSSSNSSGSNLLVVVVTAVALVVVAIFLQFSIISLMKSRLNHLFIN